MEATIVNGNSEFDLVLSGYGVIGRMEAVLPRDHITKVGARV